MVIKKPYTPRKGDVVWLDFNPQAGKEQSGRRPALVISSGIYNTKGLMIACPITSKIKGYPFEVVITGKKIKGCVLADHMKNQDWKIRNVEYIEQASQDVLTEVQDVIATLLLQ